ncbi:response regulator [Nitrosophilus alvini]|uniref:response regulator n=1 Tax=Nitrosophilus alvini TaxID=2714855 RepID=UPI00190A91CC|nr:response regulator [Nitrosophilus alvini]
MLLFRLTIAAALLFIPAFSSPGKYKIIVASYLKKEDADRALQKVKKFLEQNSSVSNLKKKQNFKILSRASGKYYIVSIEPFIEKDAMLSVLGVVKKLFPDAFWNRYTPSLTTTANNKVPSKTPKTKIEQKQPAKTDKTETEKKPISVETKKIPPLQTQTQTQTKANTENDKAALWGFIFSALIIFIFLLIILETRKKNKILSKENRELKETLKNKEEFLARFSHELRTPLNAIIGFTHIVLKNNRDRELHDNIKKIENSAELLLNLINDILDFSKIRAGKLNLENRDFNLNDLLENVADIISIIAKEKGLEFVYDIEKGIPPHLVGDPLRIKQILINLLSNAVKFTEKGEVVLKIRKLENTGKNIILEFEVKDTGIGMTPDQIKKLFKSFSQAGNSLPGRYSGTGLGLVITKELVEIMEGKIDVKSEYLKGSSFIFDIKLKVQENIDRRIYRLPSSTMLNKKILVIDNETNIHAISNILEYFHFHLQPASTFEKAKHLISQTDFDIVFVDEDMIDENVLNELGIVKKERGIKTVLIKNPYCKNRDEDYKKFFDAFLEKPFTHKSVFDILVKILQENKNAERRFETERVNFTGEKIVVAEDNEINRELIKGLLRNSGLKIYFAKNGKEAVEAVREDDEIRLVLMDLNMPVMDGYEAARAIRSFKSEDFPIIALSANTAEDEIQKISDAGMQAYLGKPIDVTTFFQTLSKYLNNKDISSKKRVNENIQKTLFLDDRLSLEGEEGEFFKNILNDFIEMFKDAKTDLQHFAKSGRFEEGERLSHEIKGVCANIGAHELTIICKKLESAFKKHDSEEIFILLPFFDIEFEKIAKRKEEFS